MADYFVGHHPTMPGSGKTAQAVDAARCLEDSAHAPMMTSVPRPGKTRPAWLSLTYDLSARINARSVRFEKRRGNESLEGGRIRATVFRCRDGADDESARRAVESDGEEDQLGSGSGDHRGDATDDAALAGTTGGARLLRPGGREERESQFPADTAEDRGRGAGVIPGEVLRPERAALSGEAGRRARHPTELHVGVSGVGGCGAGAEAAQAQKTPSPTNAAAAAGMLLHVDGSKHQWFNDD